MYVYCKLNILKYNTSFIGNEPWNNVSDGLQLTSLLVHICRHYDIPFSCALYKPDYLQSVDKKHQLNCPVPL